MFSKNVKVLVRSRFQCPGTYMRVRFLNYQVGVSHLFIRVKERLDSYITLKNTVKLHLFSTKLIRAFNILSL